MLWCVMYLQSLLWSGGETDCKMDRGICISNPLLSLIILHYHKLLSFALTFRPCFILKPFFVINLCQVQSWFESRKEDSAKASKNVPEISGASRPIKAVESSETLKGTSLNYLLLCILSPTRVFFHC